MLNVLVFIFMFFTGMMVFSSKRKHLLLMLLSLEFIILSLYMLMFIYLSMFSYEYYFSMLFLTFCVCESVLGLSILVSLIRTHGNDFFFSMNMLC
uniref:NADH dehydrogenase subunit 4L n=1 Tax=Dyscolus oopteroides TaxID=3027492 RepID=UPI0023D801C0|nr:NADH dehydrogenase subunit 4L [Dyscolus oopteroides]YP_010710258.1 NADH dehydrogenase subunit 4L [Dyscolus arauzae]YP_010710297.1 NADH dehydrogenase subunit 4L [Dyscolus fusipalpis]YP_010710310.1 NADH dehydrogenase subunit 4L [Dyscolus pollens]YP_010710323.1 NADH dehydrogenase subunit 4L [Dyscolus funereus]YP_010710336.1 NADH dehydrogenase subunit 4L [Dyscolus montivagus]WCS91679.1 NADH dehydrogenase subunit 4L [Dyscolus oopteroides]WCS91702.1 NADH dehydrogenase subunit 4L [Dyscolus arauz